MSTWLLAHGRSLDLTQPRVMAILNITPDSFADGGRYESPAAAVDAARSFVDQGADMIDIGGESTRPGAAPVDAKEQLRRVIPVIRGIRAEGGVLADVPISLDTTRAAVAAAAIEAGADAINDVSGGTDDPAVLGVAAGSGAGLILMHRLAVPSRDVYSDRYASAPAYDDVVEAVISSLRDTLIPGAIRAGVRPGQIIADPGLGFGKSVEQNLALIRGTATIAGAVGRPVLSGLSRKSFVGRVSLGRDSTPAERLAGTLALSVLHRMCGASVFRVHDIQDHVRALAAIGPAVAQDHHLPE